MDKIIWVVKRIVKIGYKEKSSLLYVCKTKELAEYAVNKLNEKYYQIIENYNNSKETYKSYYYYTHLPICMNTKFIDETLSITNCL